MTPFVLEHLVREPGGASSGRPPALILLHGLRSNEQDLLHLAPRLDPRFFVVSVRAPVVMGPAAYAWYNVQFLPDGYLIDAERAEHSRRLVLDFVDQVGASYPIDKARVFLMGFSQGAAISLAAALSSPRRFAGVVAMSGRYLEELQPSLAPGEELSGLPALAVHGLHDNVIPIGHGRALRDALSRLPIGLTYREYEMAHEVTRESLEDVAAWLRARLDEAGDWRRAGA